MGITQHPEYDLAFTDWSMYRYVMKSGNVFKNKYLEQFTTRENNTDFESRKYISYVPAHAKAAIIEIKNAIPIIIFICNLLSSIHLV
jgi:hypothetical protein